MSIELRLANVRERVHAAACRAGRDPSDITLIAVSKGHPPERIREAMAAGQVHFGESYAQQLRDKAPLLEDLRPTWHFIGPLQRNKVKYVVGTAALVHAVDGEALAREISRRSGGHPTPVLIEVNIAGEPTKHGVTPEETLALCRIVHTLPDLALLGLMCIPPDVDDPEATRPWFRALHELAARGRDEDLPLRTLSMGMSDDFEIAIEEGATHVRVGTAIFGPRTA